MSRKSLRQKFCFSLLSICLLCPINASTDPPPVAYRAEAFRTFGSIEIDGDFTESDWQNATPINQFVQIEPDEGESVTQPTEVRILYDAENIYFGFTCFDSDISRLVVNEMRRDGRKTQGFHQGLRENDNVYILLDTYNDRRSGFFFRVNPLGAREDTAVTNSGENRNPSWNAVWECQTKINDTHWTAEIAIPFNQLRFNKGDEVAWGMNIGRTIRRNQEEATWAPLSKAQGSFARYRTDDLGTLVGLQGITPKRNLELLPYILPGLSRTEEEGEDTNAELDLGMDVKYGITPNLTADLTINTDFAQVESDTEQVNLTRFSLFFPEKRPFFLEGAGLFDFGIPGTPFSPPPLLLFYSRRIGLAEGRAIPIITGGKVTGKVGPYGVGFLNVFTDAFHTDSSVTEESDIVDEPRTNYTVLRLKRDLFRGSSVGLIAINKQVLGSPSSSEDTDSYNRAGGLDFVYRPKPNLDIRGLWARTSEPDVSEQNDAFYVSTAWRSKNFTMEGLYTDIGENFNPKVGFIRQKGVRQLGGQFRYTPWLNKSGFSKLGIRRAWIGPELDFIFDRDNELETREITFSNFFRFENGSFIAFLPKHTFERLDEEFEIREDIVIPVGEYSFSELRTLVFTDDSRMLAGRLSVNFGNFYNGNRRGFSLEGSFKPNGRFSIEPQFQFNRVMLPDKAFNVSIFGSRLSYSFSTSLFVKLFAQWNSDRDVISTNFLLNYIYRPGSDFYLVFNQTYDSGAGETNLLDSTVVAKMTYWWNP